MYVPAVENVCANVAVPDAATGVFELSPEAAVGTTLAVPKLVPLAEKVTVPVGPAPLLLVAMEAVSVTEVVVVTPLAGLANAVVTVGAAVIVTVFVADVLPV